MTAPRQRGRPAHGDVLTPAEWRVAELVRHGMTNRAIAQRQGVSADAVKFHVANILAKLGFARRAEIRRWPGIREDSNMNALDNSTETLALGPIGQIARTVTDIGEARRWYDEVLGLPHLYSFGDMAFFDCGGVRLYLQQGAASTESILYFRVPDIRAAHAQLESRGVSFVAAPHIIHRHDDGTEEWMAFFDDPEGRPLAMMSAVPPA